MLDRTRGKKKPKNLPVLVNDISFAGMAKRKISEFFTKRVREVERQDR